MKFSLAQAMDLVETAGLLFPEIRRYLKFRKSQDKDEWELHAVLVQVRLGTIEDILNPNRLRFRDRQRCVFREAAPTAGSLKELRLALDEVLLALDLTDLAHTRPTGIPLWARKPPPPAIPHDALSEFARSVQDLAKLFHLPSRDLMSELPVSVTGVPDKGKSTPQWDRATEARNAWIYKECMKGVAYGTIIRRLNKKPKTWERIGSPNGIKKAARTYAEWKGLPPPPPRRRGRPSARKKRTSA